MTHVEPKLSELESVLGYDFQNENLLQEAVTHSTYANETQGVETHNERLEFVGDSVLGMLSATMLYAMFPDEPEGKLSQRRSRTVCNHALADYAQQFGLGQWLQMGQGQRDGLGKVPRSLLADAMEAVVGAVYLDGGLSAVKATFEESLKMRLLASSHRADYKTRLQEACHRRHLGQPVYKVLGSQGPAHAPTFTCAVLLGGEERGQAAGKTKSEAEQEAAQQALSGLEESHV